MKAGHWWNGRRLHCPVHVVRLAADSRSLSICYHEPPFKLDPLKPGVDSLFLVQGGDHTYSVSKLLELERCRATAVGMGHLRNFVVFVFFETSQGRELAGRGKTRFLDFWHGNRFFFTFSEKHGFSGGNGFSNFCKSPSHHFCQSATSILPTDRPAFEQPTARPTPIGTSRGPRGERGRRSALQKKTFSTVNT